MFFKNLKIYRLSSAWTLTNDQLEANLVKQAFQPGSELEMQKLGWVAPRENGRLAHVVNGQILIVLRAETKLLPNSVVNQVTRARAQELEEQQGYKPGRKQMKELKERVTDELLPRAFSLYRDTQVWIDPVNRWLVIDAAAAAKADEVIGMLAKTLDPLPLETLHVARPPASAMTDWLASDEAPSHFTIDQDTELRASGESRAAIRYVKHSIDAEDVRRHTQSGKQCTRLAMTWADRVSFMLTETLDIKRVVPLDVLKESPDAISKNDDERFDSDMALMTGELAKLLADLVEALGGEHAPDVSAAPEAPAQGAGDAGNARAKERAGIAAVHRADSKGHRPSIRSSADGDAISPASDRHALA
ncbi:recombination-associated protein RdgC [Bordetella flabilis]|uniref:recombination-associated protein RdgC n=1 Tax=Bordetella flabilis TaxID=463014 RepID=UPI0009FE0A0B|nr:recombination-associated protein RdgC [Bordetella flabilis]